MEKPTLEQIKESLMVLVQQSRLTAKEAFSRYEAAVMSNDEPVTVIHASPIKGYTIPKERVIS